MKTMEFQEWQRLSFCNSKKLPKIVVINGTRREWVGIGWVDLKTPAEPGDVVIVDSSETAKPKKRNQRAGVRARRAGSKARR